MSDMSVAQWLKKKFSRVILTAENLHKYQIDGEKFLYENPFSALFMDTGLGKTATLLRLIFRLVCNEECKNVLVVGPQRVVNVTWPDEIAEWSFGVPLTYEIIKDDSIQKLMQVAGKKARDKARIEGYSAEVVKKIGEDARNKVAAQQVRAMMCERPATIYLIHKEAVEFLVNAFGADWPFDVVIVDESSCLKDHKTNRWKALWKVRPLMKRMHQLTATPASEGYIHLYGQIALLDLGARLGKKFSNYAENYFTQNKWNRKWTPRPGAIEQITNLISDICLVMKQEDYLDLQQPQVVPHRLQLTEAETKLYTTMELESVITLGEPGNEYEVEADNASALAGKLAQMASGVVYQTVMDDIGNGDFKKRRIVHPIHDHKINMLRQLIEETEGEALLVAYYHQSSLDRILKAFPQAKVMDKEGKLIKEWNSGKIPLLLLHPQSNAHGLNLQHGGRHVVFFDLVWSYENYYQLYRRLARQGQKFLVLIHQFITMGTIDEVMAQSLEDKRDGQEIMFKWITRLRARLLRLSRKAQAQGDEDAFDDMDDEI